MNTVRRRCPVCRRRVAPTLHKCIEGHMDSLGREVCPASGEPYYITLNRKPPVRQAA